jgi:predicted esterase
LRSWSKRSAAVCAISLLACSASAQSPKPAIALVDPADAAQWRKWTQELGWGSIVPTVPNGANADVRVEAVAAAVQAAIKDGGADPAHIYLAGRAEAAAAVFYAISRVPDLWAAGLALGGSPKPALDTGRIFAANFTDTPVLWISDRPSDGPSDSAGDAGLAAQLKSAGLNLEWRSAKNVSIAQVFAALLEHVHTEFPDNADCETNAPKFAHCYWMEPTKFDVAERNEVLPASRIALGSGASLDLGEFGYKLDDPGPGVLVTVLPKDYSGPLKVGDRLIELDGQPIADARDYASRMNKTYAEKQIAGLVERGKEKLRFETRVILPSADAFVTARVQGKHDPEDKTIRIISRSVTEMRVTIPQEWVPADLYWNGVSVEDLSKPGCYLLTVDQELLNAAPCAK